MVFITHTCDYPLAGSIQKSDDVQKHIGRERTTEERLEQYNARMESKSYYQSSFNFHSNQFSQKLIKPHQTIPGSRKIDDFKIYYNVNITFKINISTSTFKRFL